MNKRKTGSAWEERAVEFLTNEGMLIKDRNYRNRQGEIDVIGIHHGFLVFVEVKYRRNKAAGYASEAVDYRKMKQICKVADYYRVVHQISDATPVRYDVVAIQGDELEWIQNAFPHIYLR